MRSAVRFAVILSLLAACGGGDTFTINSLPPCAGCGAGHIRAGASADTTVGFQADGTRVAAFGGQHVEWLDADLAVVESADTGVDPSEYVLGPYAGPVISGADGHGFALVNGTHVNSSGSTLNIVGLDTGGHPVWTDLAVDGGIIPPTGLFLADDGDLVVLADGSSGQTIAFGGMTYTGWLVIAKMAAADGSLVSAKMYTATRTTVTTAVRLSDGGFIIAGSVDGDIQLGGAVGDVKTSTLGRTAFIARLDPSGNGVWAKTWVGGGSVYVDRVASDGNRVYAEGTFTTSMDLGGGMMLSAADGVSAHFVVGLGGDGSYAWSTAPPGTIGYATIGLTPRGVLFGGSYLEATEIGGTQIPGLTTGQGGLCAELIDGTAAWVLTAVGNGDHKCSALGMAGGRSYITIDANDSPTATADTTIDTLATTGAMRMVFEVGTAPAS